MWSDSLWEMLEQGEGASSLLRLWRMLANPASGLVAKTGQCSDDHGDPS